MGPALSALATPRVTSDNPRCRRCQPGRYRDNFRFSGFVHLLLCLIGIKVCKIVFVILCYILFISACIYIFTYQFIYLGFSFTIVLYVCYLLWNDFMCILLYMIMCMLLSATSTHFKWELMLYCLHCPALNKVFLLLLLLISVEMIYVWKWNIFKATVISLNFPKCKRKPK